MSMTFAEMMAAQETLDQGVEETIGAGAATDSAPVFKLTYNADGATTARLRLLPPGPLGGRFVYKWRDHSIDKPRYMSTTCPTTFGKPCPVCEKGWDFHHEGNTEMRSKLVGAERYAAWVLVLADPLNPQNVGKIMLYRYGRMIHKMIEERLKPKFAGEEPVNVFRLDAGCDLIIKAQKVGTLPKFDGTNFAEPSVIKPPNKEPIEEMWNRIPSLEDDFISKIAPTDENKLVSIMKLAMGESIEASTPEPTTGGMPRPKPRQEDIKTGPATTALTENKPVDDTPPFDEPVKQVASPTKTAPAPQYDDEFEGLA